MTPTSALAGYAASVTFDDLPAEVVERTKFLVLDGIGCGIFGSTLPWSRLVHEAIVGMGTGDRAAVWGTGRHASADHATLINGTFVQAFELDDYSKGGIHSCAAVIPAVLAASLIVGGVSGRLALAGVVAGFEVGNRVGECLTSTALTARGWHTGAVIGPFAAAAAAGCVLGLDAAQMEHAFGIAATQASGLMSAQYGSMVKRMHHGRAGQSGLYGAALAARGFTGIDDVVERPYGGFASTYLGADPDYGLLLDGLGAQYRVLDTCVKPYASCAAVHAPVEAVKLIRERHPVTVDNIRAIRVRCTKTVLTKTGWKYGGTGSATEAQMNLSYGVAVMIIEGDAFVRQYRTELLTDPRVVELAQRVVVVHEPAFDGLGTARRRHVEVEIEFTDGTVDREELDFASGSQDKPLANASIGEKFDKLLAGVEPANAAEVKDLVLGIDTLDDVARLDAALAGLRVRAP